MKQELGPNQTRWLQALRSGEFKQGTGVLRNKDDERCCLGVGCFVFDIDGRKLEERDIEYEVFSGAWSYQGECEAAPASLIELLALRGECGEHATNTVSSLTNLNDTGSTFEKIADIIEADPAQYFTEPR